MANIAAKCEHEQAIVPIALSAFKNHIKTAIYSEWITQWKSDPNTYKHTKLFFPIMDPNYSKKILKLNRTDLKLLIEVLTGHNNLKYFSTKIKPLKNTLCRFCNTFPETATHLYCQL